MLVAIAGPILIFAAQLCDFDRNSALWLFYGMLQNGLDHFATYRKIASVTERYLYPYTSRDLGKKMVFIGGPRQVGKTTFARALGRAFKRVEYFNWDADRSRKRLLERPWSDETQIVILDEIHKYLRWKSWLKGIYDTRPSGQNFLITGSARLDSYRRGGDSMFGRYHYWRLWPFTLSEVPAGVTLAEAQSRLLSVGGFPEPFLDGGEVSARRWRRQRYDLILREDVRDLESIRDISLLALFVDELRSRVGAPIVLSNIARDLEISPATAKNWLELLERMYIVFVVRPITKSIPRAVLKPPKVYFYDIADVLGDEGARFENLVAIELMKRMQFIEDAEGYRMQLGYLRDKEGREVDFVVTRERKIEELIEVKWSEVMAAKSLLYYAERLKPQRALQIVGSTSALHRKGIPHRKAGFQLISAVDAFRGRF